MSIEWLRRIVPSLILGSRIIVKTDNTVDNG
jgi:hypothetical protein